MVNLLRGNAKSFTNISATTAAFTLPAGNYGVTVTATFGGGSVTLQRLAADASTYVTCLTALTAAGYATVLFPQAHTGSRSPPPSMSTLPRSPRADRWRVSSSLTSPSRTRRLRSSNRTSRPARKRPTPGRRRIN